MASEFYFRPVAAFRGSRDYVHSTDIYQQIIDGAALNGWNISAPMDLRINRKMTKQIIYRYSSTPAVEAKSTGAIGAIELNEKTWHVELQDVGDPVGDTKPYDEARIWNSATLGDLDVRLGHDVGMQPIEVVTALAVHLHKQRLAPAAGRRWLLARLELKRLLRAEDACNMKIAVDRRIGNSITRSQIEAADGRIGAMTFIQG
ncbi:hypothetical protein [Bradyrhizobium elkanii]|uniref:hypothetical protein n=1 Tax=Bradyrhizobium elkanii TaxID=29448 RepID=UPI001AE105BC|nr:hypothetical protein [Bradyrhizobium elkanii]MBP2434210.1 hypothetical protein [Bradyrhizobium elkanii]WLA88879.1 hypothetical protein QNJ96_27720 [Bradyrhizobium elkanii]